MLREKPTWQMETNERSVSSGTSCSVRELLKYSRPILTYACTRPKLARTAAVFAKSTCSSTKALLHNDTISQHNRSRVSVVKSPPRAWARNESDGVRLQAYPGTR